MKRNLQIWTVFLFIILGFSLKAQDPSFSQFYSHRLYLNPAFTGTQPGLTIGAHYRNQWNVVPGGFTTYSVWADIQEPNISSGFGIMALRDEEGAGGLITQGAGLSYAYILRFSSNFNINIGVRTSYWQKSVDWSKLVFTDQLHALDGIVNGTSALSNVDRAHLLDFDAGIVARWQMSIGKKDINSNIGFSVSHLTEPEESLQYIGTKIPRRYTGHIGTMIPISFFKNFSKRLIYLSPNMKADFQGDIQVFSYGLYVISNPIYVGGFYQNRTPGFDVQNTNFITVIGGVEFEVSDQSNLNIAYSFDVSVTGVSSRARGVHEISMKLNFDQASMFGIGSKYHGKKKAKSMRKGKRAKCFEFKGRDSINLY